MKKITTSDTVSVNYTGKLEDGTTFDSSYFEGREPLKVTLGQGQLIKGFENG
jgi:peptidylprolyl isomerase